MISWFNSILSLGSSVHPFHSPLQSKMDASFGPTFSAVAPGTKGDPQIILSFFCIIFIIYHLTLFCLIVTEVLYYTQHYF